MSLRRRLAGVLTGSTTAKGRAGEDRALRALLQRGYLLVERNHRNAAGELDLILRHRETLVFVEVKYRSDDRFGGAVSAVDRNKRRRMCRAAALYVATSGWSGPCRFDVVAVDYRENDVRVTLFEDAFECEEGS